ncbi:DUF192 domain-containing protein [Streptomyces sp. ISL-43]|uniref:DUF192 domain-containing protein n=1 Tax=Streptomyces sp. ISL-43 TaxID=2819183 RepID=UPI001BEC29B6|nr:DUF192 domain-containing protein [Streptomyces sp. ISL-43]MBT2450430.1 DUF192 domain-containing protein [Streptomyces sp. ISL-43]
MRIRGHWRDGGATLDLGPAPGPAGAGAVPGAPAGAPVEVPAEVRAEVRVEVAASYAARTRGLLGRDGIDGAMLLTPAASVHTFRMRFAIDVAYLDRRLRVIALTTMPPGRLGLPRLRSRHVLEAEAGAMAAWGLRVGSTLRVRLDSR